MERVIFILSYDKKWGAWMVFANRVEDMGDFFQSTGRYTGENIEVHPVVEEVLPYMMKYDIPSLFHQFGRKKYKDERDFLQRIEEGYIRENIRPYIDSYVVRIIDRLADAGFPVFRKSGRLDNYYKSQRLLLQPVFLRAVLRFERTGDFTHYILRLTDGKQMFYPGDYSMEIISRQPCRVLCGQQLFRFPEEFDGQRLLPFLQKREVMIPKANEQLYFRKFILKNIRHEEIEVEGFEVIHREVEKKAVLSLEREITGWPVLVLEYRYGNQWVPAWSGRRALVELHIDGERYAFYKVNRDKCWEGQQEKLLGGLELENFAVGCFRPEGLSFELSETETEQEKATGNRVCRKAWIRTVDWIRRYQSELQRLGIGITQKALRQNYYTGDYQMDLAVSEGTDWFELKAVVLLDDGTRIPLLRFREHILSGNREYILDDGRVFFIPEEWFSRYSGVLLFATAKREMMILHRSQYMLLEKVQVTTVPEKPADWAENIAYPRDLKAVLRPYQRLGYEWLYHLYRENLGGCLADDMGLGKTLQVIVLLLKYRQETVRQDLNWRMPVIGQQLSLFGSLQEKELPKETEAGQEDYHTCLVVVPASLVHNWKNELHRFAPSLTVTVYAGQNRHTLRPYLQRSDVVIVTYHTLRNDIDYFGRLSFGIVVADEVQVLKNPESQLHRAVLRIRGKWFYALSGTPIENSLSDLWAVMNLVNRDMLGSHHFFKKHFVKPILADFGGPANMALQKMIAPYLLRRTKEEVLADLPELTSALVICEPEEEQRKIYEEEQSRVRNYILDKREAQEGLRNDFMVLKALIRLRQMANHPRLADSAYGGDSGKFREIFRMLTDVLAAGHKVLVFSSFVKYLEMVAEEMKRLGWDYAMLTGATIGREQEIDRFNREPQCRIFLISLKAGGVGLNLTQADYVFILDPWWNPAAENQAVSRAHRMGQKQAVFVYRFITAGTLEEKILAIQRRKQQLADTIITPSTAIPLTDEELLEVI